MGNEQACCLENQDDKQLAKYENSINPIKYGGKIFTRQKNNIEKKSNNKSVFTGNINQPQAKFQHRQSYESSLKNRNKLIKNDQSLLNQKQFSERLFQTNSNQQNRNLRNRNIQDNEREIYRQNLFNKSQIANNQIKKPISTIKQMGSQQNYGQSQKFSNKSSEKRIFQKASNFNQQQRQSDRISNKSENSTRLNRKFNYQISKFPQQQQNIKIQYSSASSYIIARQSNILFNINLGPFEKQLSQVGNTNIKKIRINHNRDIYKGQINQNYQPHGYGILVKENHNVLVGYFKNGIPQAKVIYILNNGSYYKGSIKQNMANDTKGELHTKRLTYIGGFRNNQFHGDCQQLGDDYYFRGVYQRNKRTSGVLSWSAKHPKSQTHLNKTTSFNSNTDNSSINGHAFNSSSVNYNNNNSMLNNHSNKEQADYQYKDVPPVRDFQNIPKYYYVYEGNFNINQKFTGAAKLKDPNGTFMGNFQNGLKQGKGQYLYSTKLKYIGDYQNDRKQGYGILKNCDDTIAYEGNWKDGLPNGTGCSYDFQGKRTDAQFIDGLNSIIVPIQQIQSYPASRRTIK